MPRANRQCTSNDLRIPTDASSNDTAVSDLQDLLGALLNNTLPKVNSHTSSLLINSDGAANSNSSSDSDSTEDSSSSDEGQSSDDEDMAVVQSKDLDRALDKVQDAKSSNAPPTSAINARIQEEEEPGLNMAVMNLDDISTETQTVNTPSVGEAVIKAIDKTEMQDTDPDATDSEPDLPTRPQACQDVKPLQACKRPE